MSLWRLVLRNIGGNAFRSWVVALCALLVAGFVLATTLLMRGATDSLRLATARLGADIIVVPKDAQARVETALLMGQPVSAWMPAARVQDLASIPGVAAVSPQMYLSSLKGASCCSVSEMFLVAFDPATDFTVQPWLERHHTSALGPGEAIGGSYVFAPDGGGQIKLYGSNVRLIGTLEPTGTGIDNSLFLTFETARDMARASLTLAQQPLQIEPEGISAALIRVDPRVDPYAVAVQIKQRLSDVTPIVSPDLFQSFRQQMQGVLRGMVLVLGAAWALAVLLIGLLFSLVAHERQREIGVQRALGATRIFVFRSLLAEAATLALTGGIAGAALAAFSIYLFKNLIVASLGMPFLFPAWPALLAQVLVGLAVALLSVTVAAFVPALKISRQEPALVMRE